MSAAGLRGPRNCTHASRRSTAAKVASARGSPMIARIIDGKARAERLTADVRSRVAQRADAGKAVPGLAVVLVGDNSASQVYVRNKRKTTDAVGMNSFAHDLPATTTEDRASGARRDAERATRP